MAEYIERDPAVEAAAHAWAKGLEPSQYIESIPAADVAPVIRGTWQLLRHDKFSDVYQCSQCGRKVSFTHGRGVAEHYPYCHCGARMSEGPAL